MIRQNSAAALLAAACRAGLARQQYCKSVAAGRLLRVLATEEREARAAESEPAAAPAKKRKMPAWCVD